MSRYAEPTSRAYCGHADRTGDDADAGRAHVERSRHHDRAGAARQLRRHVARYQPPDALPMLFCPVLVCRWRRAWRSPPPVGDRLETVEEREQVVRRLVAAWGAADWNGPVERPLLQ